MFKLTKILMWLDKKSTGKREIAFMALIAALTLSGMGITGEIDSSDKRKIIEWWIIVAAVLVAGAFGFEALKRIVEKNINPSEPKYQSGYSGNDLAEPEPIPPTQQGGI